MSRLLHTRAYSRKAELGLIGCHVSHRGTSSPGPLPTRSLAGERATGAERPVRAIRFATSATTSRRSAARSSGTRRGSGDREVIRTTSSRVSWAGRQRHQVRHRLAGRLLRVHRPPRRERDGAFQRRCGGGSQPVPEQQHGNGTVARLRLHSERIEPRTSDYQRRPAANFVEEVLAPRLARFSVKFQF
jgi:hypothetical protein